MRLPLLLISYHETRGKSLENDGFINGIYRGKMAGSKGLQAVHNICGRYQREGGMECRMQAKAVK